MKPREWFVPDIIPARTVTNLSGDGGTGKSQLVLQLIASSALRCDWLGLPVAEGPCLFYTAEDEDDELHRRLACIVEHKGSSFAALSDVRLISMADRDALLAIPDRDSQMNVTPTFVQLCAEAASLKPKLIVIDTSADAFGGDEIKRAQVRQFVGKLRELAMAIDCAVLLLSHPSVAGMTSGTGASGSTAWNNSVRSRLYLDAVEGPDGESDPTARTLTVKKSNYGPAGESIAIRWAKGVFVLDTGPDAAVGNLQNAIADKVFLELLAMFAEQNQDLSTKPSATYAPSVMSRDPRAKGFKKRQLEAAMQRLIQAKRIHIVTEGPPSKQRKRFVVGPP